MRSRNAMVIDFGRRRIRALLATVTSGGSAPLRVKQTLSEVIPADLNADDPRVLGEWLASRLKAAKISRTNAVISIGREHVGVKRMTLPTIDNAELPDMTRLAMHRELPFDADSAVIDFIPLERTDVSTTVLAVAAPRAIVEFARAVADAAGIGIARITPRTMGAAAILSTCHGTHAAGMAIDVTGEGVEFCIIVGGSIQFSRAAEVPQPQDHLSIADAVVTETRRTWMSYRSAAEMASLPMALVMGDRRISEYASAPLGEILKIPVEVLERHSRVSANQIDIDRFWPLVGLLLEPALHGELIDLNSPRRAPDLGARKRIRRLLAAAVVVLSIGVLWTLAQRDLQNLQANAKLLVDRQASEVHDYARYWRDKYKLEHLKQWESIGADWLQHACYLNALAPPPGEIVLDEWSGTLQTRGVHFDKKTDKWFVDEEMTIVLDGEAKDRETADAFRESLVQTTVYTASSPGADKLGGKRLPYGFLYRLRTKIGTVPAEVVSASAPSNQNKNASANSSEQDIATSTEVASR